jgi:PPM family protein phosphatase
MISEPQIAGVLEHETGLDGAAARLIAEANAAGGRDNITVVLFRLEEIGADDVADEDATAIGLPAVSSDAGVDGQNGSSDDGITRVHRPVSASGEVPAMPPPTTGNAPQTAKRPRLARTQGARPEPVAERGRSLKFKVTAAIVSIAIVLLLVGGGGYLATRQLYFIGTNSDGIVTLYSGLPYEFLGVPLWEQSYVSGLPASQVPAAQRSRLLNHNLRSQKDSIALIRAAELGDLPR